MTSAADATTGKIALRSGRGASGSGGGGGAAPAAAGRDSPAGHEPALTCGIAPWAPRAQKPSPWHAPK
eukprot:1350540-Pyramimonas_sp.AAC.1